MKLYYVTKWFNRNHPDAYDKVNYGFLDDSLFFHRSAIVRGSALLEKDTLEGLWVICEEIPSRKKAGSFEASHVKLFEEASAEEKAAALADAPVNHDIFSLRSSDPAIKEIFLQRCRQTPLSDLLYSQYLSDAEVKEIIFEKCRQVPLIDLLKSSRLFQTELRPIFLQRCQQASLSELIRLGSLFDRDIQNIFLQKCSQEPRDHLLSLIREIQKSVFNADSIISQILPQRPELLEDAALCATLTPAYFQHFSSTSPLVQREEQLKFFLTHLPDKTTKAYLVNHHTDKHTVIRNPEAWNLADDNKLAEIISLIDWQNTQSEYLTAWQALLARIEADVQIQAATAIAVSMREKNAAFHPAWWKILNDSIKIRILIYQSNFPDERAAWSSNIKQIRDYEIQKKNDLLLAVLYFFVNVYYTNSPEKAQERFMIGDGYLMKYIEDLLYTHKDIPHELNTLLDKCQKNGYSNTPYFCDAIISSGKKRESDPYIYCPLGRHRPVNDYGDEGRQSCPVFPGTDLTATKYRQATAPNYSDQYFADLLLNVGVHPDLRAININPPTLYPFRIAAWVNRSILIRPHLKCKCGKPLKPYWGSSKKERPRWPLTMYYCTETTFQSNDSLHNSEVYLNNCYHCNQIIDSRECKQRNYGDKGQWLCMRCGKTEEIKEGVLPPMCPVCRSLDVDTRNPFYISCQNPKCGHKGRDFHSIFEGEISDYVKTSEAFRNSDHTASYFHDDELPF